MPCRPKVILIQASLVVLVSVILTEAAPRQQDFQNPDAFWKWLKERMDSFPQDEGMSDEGHTQMVNDELKQKIQSIIDDWKPGDYGEYRRPEIRQRMESLAKQMDASESRVSRGGSVPDSSEVKEFFDDMTAAISQKIQDLLESVRELLSAEISLTSTSLDDDTPQLEDLIYELIIKEIRQEVDRFIQELQDDLNDIADSFPGVSREDVEKIIKYITEEAESQIDEWMKEIQGLFNNPGDSLAVHERIRLFINQRTSMNNAKMTREVFFRRFQSFITQRSQPSTLDSDLDLPDAEELNDFFNKTSREIRQQFEAFLDNLQEAFDDLRRFNFTDIDFDMEDFIDDLVNETTQRLDQFLKEIQEALGNVPDYLQPPSREDIRHFFNETLHETCEQIRQTIDEIRDFLENIFGINTDNDSTGRDSSFSLSKEDTGVFMSAADDSLSLSVDRRSEEDGKSSNSIGTTAIVLICVGAVCGTVVAGVVVRRRILPRRKMYKHVNSPSAAKLQEASLKAMANSSYEYGTCENASLKSTNYKGSL